MLPVFALWGVKIPAFAGPAEGGWHALAVFYAFWEPLVAWGIILGLLAFFQSRMSHPGPIWRALAEILARLLKPTKCIPGCTHP